VLTATQGNSTVLKANDKISLAKFKTAHAATMQRSARLLKRRLKQHRWRLKR
jgi:hypothetical protein